jgi:hypothetical protein
MSIMSASTEPTSLASLPGCRNFLNAPVTGGLRSALRPPATSCHPSGVGWHLFYRVADLDCLSTETPDFLVEKF